MLNNYLKIAFRTLWKQKGITAINVLGMAAGMAVCLLVGLLLWDQLTHDNFHPDADRLYRLVMEVEGELDWAATPADVAPALRREVAGVEAATRLHQVRGNVLVDEHRYSVRGYYAEPSFFDVFGFELTRGSASDALSAPGSAVITEDLARRLYGDADPIGRTFIRSDSSVVTITAVVNRQAYRSHLTFDILYAFAAAPQNDLASLGRTYTYFRIGPQQGPTDFASRLQPLVTKYVPDNLPSGSPAGFGLQAVSDIPLGGHDLMAENARDMLPSKAAYFLAACAFLVLLAAGFNYLSLSAARSLTRAHEVGVRKTLGAHRLQVMGPFLAEAILVALGALAVGALALEVLIPAFNGLSIVYEGGYQIEIRPDLWFYGTFAVFAAGVGLLAGLYPAWHLSDFQPVGVMKSGRQPTSSESWWMVPRKLLTVLQFTVALVVLVTAALLYRQFIYMSEAQGAGFRTERLLYVDLQEVGYQPFQQEARQLQGVERVAGASHLPLTGWRTAGVLIESDRTVDSVSARTYAVDFEFVEALDLPLIAASEWSEARFETGQAVLISETAAQQLGFAAPSEAIGEPLTLSRFRERSEVRVAGVVRDVYLGFMEGPSQPVLYQYDPSLFSAAMVQVSEGQQEAVLEALGGLWNQFEAGDPLNAQSYRSLIASDRVGLKETAWILGFVAGLAALISSLGLLGIATYQVQTRIREIGIRKSLGATVASVVGLLSKDVLWLIGTAIALGVPTAWWINEWWLQGFAYRIELSGVTFAVGAAAVVGLALLALAPQAMRVARVNPAETLREE